MDIAHICAFSAGRKIALLFVLVISILGSMAPAWAGGGPRSGIAEIRIPKFGAKYRFSIFEGVSARDLLDGPGHETGTAAPGGVGNFVLSGHRTTHHAPFNRIDELVPGDEILIDTPGFEYVYHVTGKMVVTPTELDVAAPVPFHPGLPPTDHLITLT